MIEAKPSKFTVPRLTTYHREVAQLFLDGKTGIIVLILEDYCESERSVKHFVHIAYLSHASKLNE